MTTRQWAALVLCAALGGCTTDFDRFKIGDGDPDGGVVGGDGDRGSDRFGIGGDGDAVTDDGDGDPAAGDGDTATGDGDGDVAVGDGDATPGDDMVTPECEVDDDCNVGFVCTGGACAFVPPERLPNATVQTSGGGLLIGSGHRLQLRVGAPAPMGHMEGSGHKLIIGPLAGRASQQ